MDRPTEYSEFLTEYIDKVSNEVYTWCEHETDLEDIKKDIEKIFNSYEQDGYDLAKEMDDIGYCPDSDLVEILDNIPHYKRLAKKEAIKKWIKEFNIVPKLKINDNVKVIRDRKNYEGIIVDINKEEGTYTVSIPELGHIGHESKTKGKTGTIGTVIAFENIEKIN